MQNERFWLILVSMAFGFDWALYAQPTMACRSGGHSPLIDRLCGRWAHQRLETRRKHAYTRRTGILCCSSEMYRQTSGRHESWSLEYYIHESSVVKLENSKVCSISRSFVNRTTLPTDRDSTLSCAYCEVFFANRGRSLSPFLLIKNFAVSERVKN